jgi:hypothetical protein
VPYTVAMCKYSFISQCLKNWYRAPKMEWMERRIQYCGQTGSEGALNINTWTGQTANGQRWRRYIAVMMSRSNA